ncbi:DICT sensory domain-containing protein [Pseudonocardia sp. HH130630-07]|uniref:DICT sensory domain-containing protein n=1 Tax=Pseudonocardia sp. HH130630-07 TaxID=1690815 RepID=UPI000814CE80|nr:DICT sensory domain-containing protein [Pseudonocardia sp. HH130630-07]ANY07026.1 hypothetical protein AFB00_12820 [Pseudonocardia sp. HH130630-07]
MSGSEGPLAHAVRVAAEQAYVDGLSEGRREAWERASGATPEPASKRLLVHLSHSIERAVMSGPRIDPTVVIALFQKLPFFDREREVYARMAEAGIHVVVGFVDGEAHEAPPGVHLVSLQPGEPLADEWTVVAAGPEGGAFLVATDQHARDPKESGDEAGRLFHGRWGYARAAAGSELARLRFALGDRLDSGIRRTIDELLARSMPAGGDPAASSGTTGEAWATTSLNHMIDKLLSARAGTRELRAQLADAQRAAAARSAAVTDPASGLPTAEVLDRWTGPVGPETLAVGVAVLDLPALAGDRVRSDDRAAYFAAHQVAAALTQPLGPVDTAVRLSQREFALVLPGASERHLAGVCDRIGEQLQLASQGYPGVPLHGRVGLIVTCTRPLPVDDLRAALEHLPEDPTGHGPVDAGATPAGDRIVVAAIGTPGSATDATIRAAERGTGSAAVHGVPAARDREPSSGDRGPSAHARGTAPGGADPVAPPPHAHAPAPQQAPPVSRPRPYLDAGSGGPESVADDDPRAAAQQALRRLVHGDGGDTSSGTSVFTDLSGTRNGTGNRGW